MHEQRARGGECVGATGPDGENAVVRLDDVAGTRDDEPVILVADHEQRLETTQHAIAAPARRELNRRPRKILGIALELLLELLEESECVGGGARESREHLASLQRANLLRVGLHDGLADAYLPVAADGNLAVAPHAENGGGVNSRKCVSHAERYHDHQGANATFAALAWWARCDRSPFA